MDKHTAIVAAAQAYLAQHGFHASGVEQLAEAADITKRTLYNRFGSKEALLSATLQYRDEVWTTAMQQALNAAPPQEALNAYADYIAHWTAGADFYGCYFVNACAEFADHAHEIHTLAAAHKQRILAILSERLPFDGANTHSAVVAVTTMAEGVISVQHVSGNADDARDALRLMAQYWTERLRKMI